MSDDLKQGEKSPVNIKEHIITPGTSLVDSPTLSMYLSLSLLALYPGLPEFSARNIEQHEKALGMHEASRYLNLEFRPHLLPVELCQYFLLDILHQRPAQGSFGRGPVYHQEYRSGLGRGTVHNDLQFSTRDHLVIVGSQTTW